MTKAPHFALTTPVEIDTAIAQSLTKQASIEQRIEQQEYMRDHHSLSYNAATLTDLYRQRRIETNLQAHLNAKYTGWERYWHVTNTNGHIHTSMSCSSCFPETQFGWRTDLSGLTPEQVVEREAYNACSVCMPIAPAEQRAARQRYNAEQRQARKDERDAKAAEKLRKAAERAKKLMVKVEAAYESLGGEEAVRAMPLHGDGSLYCAVYAFGDFEDRTPLQQTVADVLLDDDREQREGKRYSKDPRKVIVEAAQAQGRIL